MFLDEIEANVPRDLDVHLVIDNCATHKTPLIRNWLARRPRRHVHLTPTSSSWLNHVERFFALQNPSAGPNRPTISSPRSSASAATQRWRSDDLKIKVVAARSDAHAGASGTFCAAAEHLR